MICKRLLLLMFLLLFSISFLSCGSDSDDSGSSKEASDEMKSMSGEVYSAVSVAMTEAMTEAQNGKSKAAEKGSYSFSYAGSNWSVSGLYTWNDSYMYPMTYDFDVTWNGYTYGNVTLVSGSTEYEADFISGASWESHYTGDFVVQYNDDSYDYEWNIDVSYDNGSYSYSGTYTVDGEEYSWEYSGTAK